MIQIAFMIYLLIYFVVFGRSAVDDGEWVAGPDDLDSDETQVTVRQFFPETWIWEQRKTG